LRRIAARFAAIQVGSDLQVVKENKAFESPREKTLEFFSRGDLYFSRDFHLSFVCGAADRDTGEPLSFRTQFLCWAQQHEPKLICVQAENAVTDLLRQADEVGGARSLAVIERMIADTVDSLLIFPESPGSFAELGLFAASDDLCKKTLVAMLAEHQGPSFITLGPVRHIALLSAFAPVPIVLVLPFADAFQQIADRLLGEMKHKRSYRRRFALKEWSEYTKREKLAILDGFFELTGICTEEDLFDFLGRRFGLAEQSEVRLLTALLAALGRVEMTDDADIVRIFGLQPLSFMEGAEDDAIELKAKWNEAYRIHLPEAAGEIASRNP
jgi:hypothetical protein